MHPALGEASTQTWGAALHPALGCSDAPISGGGLHSAPGCLAAPTCGRGRSEPHLAGALGVRAAQAQAGEARQARQVERQASHLAGHGQLGEEGALARQPRLSLTLLQVLHHPQDLLPRRLAPQPPHVQHRCHMLPPAGRGCSGDRVTRCRAPRSPGRGMRPDLGLHPAQGKARTHLWGAALHPALGCSDARRLGERHGPRFGV